MITKLDWDTECFGYPVGRLIIQEPHKFGIDELKINAKPFRLLYVYSKTELKVKLADFILVDTKVVYKRETELITTIDFSNIESFKGVVTTHLLNLTLQSGLYSRFNTDKHFVNNEFRTLYKLWIENSINRKIARDVFVYKSGGKLVGFVTLSSSNNTAEIGLIAVDLKFRGQGIGSELVRFIINEAKRIGYPELRVTTQQENESAVSLYKRNDFRLEELTYIYHYWNR